MAQLTTYVLFSVIWPLLFALVYWQLEKLFPTVLTPQHTTKHDKVIGE